MSPLLCCWLLVAGCWFPLPLRVRGHLRAEAFLLRSELGGELGAEVRRLEHLPDLDLGVAVERVRTALDPFDRFVLRFHLDQQEAGDELFGLGERPVDARTIRAREPD